MKLPIKDIWKCPHCGSNKGFYEYSYGSTTFDAVEVDLIDCEEPGVDIIFGDAEFGECDDLDYLCLNCQKRIASDLSSLEELLLDMLRGFIQSQLNKEEAT